MIADLSPFSDVTRRLLHQHRLSLSFLSCFFILYHFLSPLLLLFFTLSSHLPFRRPAIHLSNTLQSSLSLSLPHLAILLHLHLYSTFHLSSPQLLIALSISLTEDQYQLHGCFSSLPSPPLSSHFQAHLLVCCRIRFSRKCGSPLALSLALCGC